jgi:PEP-CTERM motif
MKHSIGAFGGFLSVALYAGIPAQAAPIFVEQGSTYLRSQPGQLVTGGPFDGAIFDPTPIAHGANLVITRTQDIEINGAPGVIQLVAIAMHSRAPVLFGGNLFDVFVDLDPAHLADDVGTLTITGDLTGGTATEMFSYFARFSLVDAVTHASGPTQVIKIDSVSAAPFAWSPNPTPGAVIVIGPDGGQDDPLVSLRTGLANNEVNFFPSGAFQTIGTGLSGGSTTATVTPNVPEPGSILLLGLGLAALRLSRRERAGHMPPCLHENATRS